jgi:hypothetical protein
MRIALAALVAIVLLCVAVIVVRVTVEIPSVAVCSRARSEPDIEVSSTRIGGYFEQRRVGPCVLYTHEGRGAGGGGGD